MVLRALTLALALAVSPAAMAAPAGTQMAQVEIQSQSFIPVQGRGERAGPRLQLREVVDMVRARFGGDLINAHVEDGPRPIYVLRWRMPNNDVRDIRVDAMTGQFR
jgi:uncharacterized membrane protein YkoI